VSDSNFAEDGNVETVISNGKLFDWRADTSNFSFIIREILLLPWSPGLQCLEVDSRCDPSSLSNN
jgi:hypothetical protein